MNETKIEKKAKSMKKGFFAILKESMTKSSSGCGPGCGCHVENQDKEKQRKDKPGNNKDQT